MVRKSKLNMSTENVLIIALVVVFIVLSILYLTDNKNEGFTSDANKIELSFFFADWCPHCRNFKPEFARLEQHVKSNYPNKIAVKQYDCTNQNSQGSVIARQRGVNGYPTMMLGSTEFPRGSLGDMIANLQRMVPN